MTTDDEGGRGRLTGPAGPDEEPHTPAAPAPDAPGPNAPLPDAPGPNAPVPDAVTCRALRYAFGETKAVDGVDLSVRTGEVFGLLGPNGAGKTTAIRCITTLLPCPRGHGAGLRARRGEGADGGAPAARVRPAAAVRGRRADRPGERRAVRPGLRRLPP
ncbi:ATP-binding cassette domain-containing protein [Streptomyces libani]